MDVGCSGADTGRRQGERGKEKKNEGETGGKGRARRG